MPAQTSTPFALVHRLIEIDRFPVDHCTVARLHGNATFRAQMALATNEVAKARAQGQVPPVAGCAAEAATLATSARLAP